MKGSITIRLPPSFPCPKCGRRGGSLIWVPVKARVKVKTEEYGYFWYWRIRHYFFTHKYKICHIGFPLPEEIRKVLPNPSIIDEIEANCKQKRYQKLISISEKI
ncbi:MAG: hypothetical protein QXF83_06895 [Candidatus Bathyarchaeia archaeon]